MQAEEISYDGFRNIDRQSIRLDKGVNILCGKNAQGKTNALEGIYLFAQGRSHRTSREREYIMEGRDWAALSLTYYAQGRAQKSELRYLKNGRKSVRKNGVSLRKMSEFIGSFRAVMFCPEHLTLIKEGPAGRRRFLDGAISQLNASYLRSVQRYNAVLLQRNRLLSSYEKDERTVMQTLEIWNEQLAQEGEYISEKREQYTERVEQAAKEVFSEMTDGREIPQFRYTGRRSRSELLAELKRNEQRDLRIGTTGSGVHKDDISILINGKEARAYASQGQQRTLALAMKLAEAEISRKETGEAPVLLLDDILSELDETRRKYVLTGIGKGQVIITACEKEPFTGIDGNIITVENGRYE